MDIRRSPDRPPTGVTTHARGPRRLRRLRIGVALAAVPGLALLTACRPPGRVPVLVEPGSYVGPAGTEGRLKAHLHSGDLLVFDQWQLVGDSAVRGEGRRYDADRDVREGSQEHLLPIDSVALFETSVRAGVDGAYTAGTVPLVTLSVLSAAVTGICLADPKACFGSCPTFYVEQDGQERLVAEGFSSSVARVLEARDVDALAGVTGRPGPLRIRMRNEALETHAIRSLGLLAVPTPGVGDVVVTTTGDFHRVDDIRPPTACRALEGDCRSAVASRDGVERRSWTDPLDLATRETIELEFSASEGPQALVLSARHTFVSTFLFYQTLAYLGRNAAPLIAELERGDEALRDAVVGPMRALGGLRVQVADSEGRWITTHTFEEAGPLATDRQAVPLPSRVGSGPLRVRLDMVEGYWRLDEVALATLGEPVRPVRIEPTSVRRYGAERADPEAKRRLVDSGTHLVTQPGDELEITFDIPSDADEYTLFLESEGYYYEWMRQEWMAEEDPAAAALMLTRPEVMFRRLAPEFKEREARMEEIFWNTRIGRKLP